VLDLPKQQMYIEDGSFIVTGGATVGDRNAWNKSINTMTQLRRCKRTRSPD